MRKNILLAFAFSIASFFAIGQNFKIGLQFTPFNSEYYLDDVFDNSNNNSWFYHDVIESRNDSITIGIFSEKYFEAKSFLIRLNFNYASLNKLYKENDLYTDNSVPSTSTYNYEQTEKQKYYNFNLGIGDRVSLKKFVFSFGVYVPLTILPKGEITRDVKSYDDQVLQYRTNCTGTYKGTLGYGIGSFAEINTTILKHFSFGIDFNYQIQHLTRNLEWHGEHLNYQNDPLSPTLSTSDETYKIRKYFTSKITPSIVIAYCFNKKAKSEPMINN